MEDYCFITTCSV